VLLSEKCSAHRSTVGKHAATRHQRAAWCDDRVPLQTPDRDILTAILSLPSLSLDNLRCLYTLTAYVYRKR
jgi:hypothetical protein